jgi:lysophospholipase L1-like esterase
MPATATGRGAQVILDGDAQRAARGAYANSYVANAMYLDSLARSGAVADGITTPDGTTRSGTAASDYLIGTSNVRQDASVSAMARSAAVARTNNPRVNPIMTTPPTITASGTPTAGLSNVWINTGAKAAAFNYLGGQPLLDGALFTQLNSVTVSGGYTPFLGRFEIVADAVKVMFTVLNVAGSATARFIVNGQYVSLTPTTPAGGGGYITLDFTAAGGRAVRTITMEGNASLHFQAVTVGPTETVTRPAGVPQRMFVVGDSWVAAGGASSVYTAFPQVMADLLGIRDIWNGGVGGTGYLATASGAQGNYRQRLSDMITAAPDIVVIEDASNDLAFTPAAVQAEVTAYLSAILQQPVLAGIPIVVTGVNGGNIATATTAPYETAIANAVAAINDPLVYFIPNISNPAGPYMTGTGNTAAPNGTGNCDLYISSDNTHPNDAGHAYLARCLAADIARLVLKA